MFLPLLYKIPYEQMNICFSYDWDFGVGGDGGCAGDEGTRKVGVWGGNGLGFEQAVFWEIYPAV